MTILHVTSVVRWTICNLIAEHSTVNTVAYFPFTRLVAVIYNVAKHTLVIYEAYCILCSCFVVVCVIELPALLEISSVMFSERMSCPPNGTQSTMRLLQSFQVTAASAKWQKATECKQFDAILENCSILRSWKT